MARRADVARPLRRAGRDDRVREDIPAGSAVTVPRYASAGKAGVHGVRRASASAARRRAFASRAQAGSAVGVVRARLHEVRPPVEPVRAGRAPARGEAPRRRALSLTLTTRAAPRVDARSTSPTVCASSWNGEAGSPRSPAGRPIERTVESSPAVTARPSARSNHTLATMPCTDGGAPVSHVAWPGPVSVSAYGMVAVVEARPAVDQAREAAAAPHAAEAIEVVLAVLVDEEGDDEPRTVRRARRRAGRSEPRALSRSCERSTPSAKPSSGTGETCAAARGGASSAPATAIETSNLRRHASMPGGRT